jgi:hypothetical protein
VIFKEALGVALTGFRCVLPVNEKCSCMCSLYPIFYFLGPETRKIMLPFEFLISYISLSIVQILS